MSMTHTNTRIHTPQIPGKQKLNFLQILTRDKQSLVQRSHWETSEKREKAPCSNSRNKPGPFLASTGSDDTS